jgi:hypothetical protein
MKKKILIKGDEISDETIKQLVDELLKGVYKEEAAKKPPKKAKNIRKSTSMGSMLSNIKMTPKKMQSISGILERCNGHVQEIFIFLMEKWAKAGYIVETTSTSIVLDIPNGNKTARLAMLMSGDYPPSKIILFWESLRKRQVFPTESIDAYQKAIKKITTLHITESSAHIDPSDQFDMKAAQALLKAMKALAKSVRPEMA